MTRFKKHVEKKEQRAVSDVEAYVLARRGNQEGTWCNQRAAQVLDAYSDAAKEMHGPDFDVMHSPIDVAAVYKAGAGKKHGRHMMANGFIDSRVTLSEAQASVSGSSGDVRPQRRLRPSTDRISELETQVAQMKDIILQLQSQINGTTPRPPISTLSTPGTAGSSAAVESNHDSADGHGREARCSPVEDHVARSI